MRTMILFLLPILTFAWPGNAHSGTEVFNGLSGELRIVGSAVGLAAVREAADRIVSANPAVKINFSITGAGAGARRVRLRQADLSLFDRDPVASPGQGTPLTYVAYGVDPVAIVVNPANIVGQLTVDQLRKLFSHQIRLWSEVGGDSYPVIPLLVVASGEEDGPESKPSAVSSQPAMRFTMVRNKEAIGFISMRDQDASLKSITVDGAQPEMASFTAGRYKIYRTMYMVAGPLPSPLAKAFLEYMAGPEGQSILEKTGYVPLAAKPQWKSALPVGQPDRLAQGL